MRTSLKLWQLVPGNYVLNQGEMRDGEYPFQHRYAWTQPRTVKLMHRADTVCVNVPPSKVWVVDLRLDTLISVPKTAPDLAISARDMKRLAQGIQVTVHNIGNRDSTPTILTLKAKRGGKLAVAGVVQIPAIPTVRNFTAGSKVVTVSVKEKELAEEYRLTVDPEDRQYELCETNNSCVWSVQNVSNPAAAL